MILDRAMIRNRPQKLSMTFTDDEQLRQFITLEGFLLGGRFRDIKRVELSAVGMHVHECFVDISDHFAWIGPTSLEAISVFVAVRPKVPNALRDL